MASRRSPAPRSHIPPGMYSMGEVMEMADRFIGQRRRAPFPVCAECGDTGAINTGNNDLPCACERGKTALFNVAGHKEPQTGAQVTASLHPEPATAYDAILLGDDETV